MTLENRLPEPTTVHWHGVPVPNAMGGVPGVTQPAGRKAKDPTIGLRALGSSKPLRIFSLLLLLTLLIPSSVTGASASRGAAAQQSEPLSPGEALTVYLMTVGPGNRIWQKFGHNAIVIRDAAAGSATAYNWGVFSFEQQDFMQRFILGRMRYIMAAQDADSLLRSYVADDRSVWLQELRLTPDQRAELQAFVEWKARPENRAYAYDYYRDNCSTRVRDVLDAVLGGEIRAATIDVPAGATYRAHTRRLLQRRLYAYASTLLALGQPVDRPITRWEEMFLPLELRDLIRSVRVPGPEGEPVPFLASEREVFLADRPPLPDRVPSFFFGFLLTGMAVGSLLAGLGWWARGGPRGARWGLFVAGGTWSLIAGLAGIGIALLWALTDHTAAYHNENLLQVFPIVSLLVVLLPLSGVSGRAATAARWTAAATAGAAALGLVCQALPAFDQVNGSIIALCLPAHGGLAVGVWQALD